MGHNVAIGLQDFVTLLTRPRRFGKTFNMSMSETTATMDIHRMEDPFEGKKY